MAASPPSSPADFIPFHWGKELYGRLARMSDLQAALTVGVLAWIVTTFFYAPPFWLPLAGGGPHYSRIDGFIQYCKNPLTRAADPLLAYRITTPVLAWLLGLRGFSGIIIQYAAIVATLALVFHVLARKTDRYLSLLVTLGIACTYTIIWTNTKPGFPDSVTELAIVLTLLSPSPFLAAGMTLAGMLNDERFIIAVPFVLLWHSGTGSLGDILRQTWKPALGFAVGLAGVLFVRHALTVGWIGAGITLPREYREFRTELATLTPMAGRRAFLINIPLSFRAMWSLPVLFLIRKTHCSTVAKNLYFIAFAGAIIATAAAADVARNIGFLFPALLFAAWQCHRVAPRLTLQVCAFSLLACLLLPAFYYHSGGVYLERPLPLSLLRAWTGWDILSLIHHVPRVYSGP